MKMILLIGIPASGKSSFYLERFFRTHIRINLDMLKNRKREEVMVNACLAAKQPFVVDNTNPTKDDRQRYIVPAEKAGFVAEAYYFETSLDDALRRNAARPSSERIPDKGIRNIYERLEAPSVKEGFDKLFMVRLNGKNGFLVKSIESSSKG
jgi:predicted kinase